MHRRKYILTLSVVFYVLFLATVAGQEIVSVMPYEIFGGKMLVNMRVNGKTERFIFDTGADRTALTDTFVESNSLPEINSVTMKDVNGTELSYRQTNIDSISTCDNKITRTNIPVIIINGKAFMNCFDAVGLLGSDFMADLICIIDPKMKTITLISAEKRSPESLRYAHSFVEKSLAPTFETMVNGEPVIMLFDTGASGVLQLNKTGYNRLNSRGLIKTLDVGSGGGSLGVGGRLTSSSVEKVSIDNFRIGVAKFANVVATTSNSDYPILGMALLNYGKVVIDYSRRLFYFIPFSKDPVLFQYAPRKFEIQVSRDGSLKVGMVWTAMADVLSTGDTITHINGKPTTIYDYCTSMTLGVEDLRGKGPFVMTIKTKDGKELEVEY